VRLLTWPRHVSDMSVDVSGPTRLYPTPKQNGQQGRAVMPVQVVRGSDMTQRHGTV
jgi:hypothetical protein